MATAQLETLGLDSALEELDQRLLTQDAESVFEITNLIRDKWGAIDASEFPHHEDDAANTMQYTWEQLERRRVQIEQLEVDLY